MVSLIGSVNVASETQSSGYQCPASQPQLLRVTVTRLRNVTSSPNSLKEYASAPTLGRFAGSGVTVPL